MVISSAANAAKVSGKLAKGKGYTVILVQEDGDAKKATVKRKNGKFKIGGVSLSKATLHLVKSDGTYYGPIVLRSSKKKAYATIRGKKSLSLGTIKLKSGYAVAKKKVSKKRVATSKAYAAKAKRRKPVGAGKFGLVKIGNGTKRLSGYAGQGRDMDLDGIVGAFDIDDDGDLILDNLDRSERKSRKIRGISRTSYRVLAPAPDYPAEPADPPETDSGLGSGSATTSFQLFSNFKLTGLVSLNANLIGLGVTDLNALIDEKVPQVVSLATEVVGGTSGTLDCLGTGYCAAHTVGTESYPVVNMTAATYTGTLLDIWQGTTGDAQISPGALPAEIGSGDAFLQTVGATSYASTLNFVFNTAPAVVSYETSSSGGVVAISYDSDGYATPYGGVLHQGFSPFSRIEVPSDGQLTLTWWRPQRQAITSAGEVGDANGWMDIGSLEYSADIPNAMGGSSGTAPGLCSLASYSNTLSDGTAFTNTGTDGVLDPELDRAADPGQTLSFTLDLATCFGTDWTTAISGAEFDVDIQARSVNGDNAARKLYFTKA